MTIQAKVPTCHKPPVTTEWRAFARYVARLLATSPRFWDPPAQLAWLEAASLCQTSGKDRLLLLKMRRQSWRDRLLHAAGPAQHFVKRPNLPVLITQQVHWPFHRLLLVLRDEPADEAAIAWLLRLARASRADVTILPVVPSLPALYALGSRGQPDLAMLLAPNTSIGCKIRRVATTLQRAGIHSLTRQRRGTPDRQIREEAAVGDHDLIVIGAESGGRIYRWFAGELVPQLLHWRRRPVLVANVAEGA